MAWDDTAKILQEEAADATKVTIELIKKRLAQLPELTQRVDAIIEPYRLKPDGSRRKAADLKEILKKLPADVLQEYKNSTQSIYRVKEYLKDEVGDLNRALGELLTAEGRQLYLQEGGLFETLFPKGGLHKLDTFTSGIYNEKLAENLRKFETNISKYTDTIKSKAARFTVGHHQHLASFRELGLKAHKAMNPQWWADYTKLALDRGFNIGDLGILRLARQGHKPLLKYKTGPLKGQYNIDGFLKDLGITSKTPGFSQLYEATQGIMAHAGGTGGIKIPFQFFKLPPAEAIKASMPILETERAMSQSGEIWTNLVRNWSNKIKEGGGKVSRANIDQLTRLTHRLKENLIGTTDGKSNLSIPEFIEKGRLRTNVILEQLKELKHNQFDLSGFKEAEQKTLEKLLVRKAGAVKTYIDESVKQVPQKFATVVDEAGKFARKVQINPRVQAVTGGVVDATKTLGKTPLRSVVPFIGPALTVANLNERLEAQELDPTFWNARRLDLAKIETGLEAADIVTGGLTSPFTALPQIGIAATDLSIGALTSAEKPKTTDQISSNVGPGPTQAIGDVQNIQINRPQNWITPISLY